MRRRLPCIAASAVLLLARGALAEDDKDEPTKPERIRPFQLAVGAAGSGVPGAVPGRGRGGFGLFAGGIFSTSAIGSATRPFVGLGVDLELGSVMREVREGGLVNEEDSVPAYTLGPQARVGLGFGTRHQLTSLYLGLTPFYTETDRPAPWSTEDGGTWGFRALVGVSLLDSWPLIEAAMPHGGSCEAGLCGITLFLFLLPTTLELGWEHVRDEDRGAVFLGYTL